ncbi:MAG: hypothetical protein AB2A00_02415 [Myxococcota bacterium]
MVAQLAWLVMGVLTTTTPEGPMVPITRADLERHGFLTTLARHAPEGVALHAGKPADGVVTVAYASRRGRCAVDLTLEGEWRNWTCEDHPALSPVEPAAVGELVTTKFGNRERVRKMVLDGEKVVGERAAPGVVFVMPRTEIVIPLRELEKGR